MVAGTASDLLHFSEVAAEASTPKRPTAMDPLWTLWTCKRTRQTNGSKKQTTQTNSNRLEELWPHPVCCFLCSVPSAPKNLKFSHDPFQKQLKLHKLRWETGNPVRFAFCSTLKSCTALTFAFALFVESWRPNLVRLTLFHDASCVSQPCCQPRDSPEGSIAQVSVEFPAMDLVLEVLASLVTDQALLLRSTCSHTKSDQAMCWFSADVFRRMKLTDVTTKVRGNWFSRSDSSKTWA